jgi:hypothetical protein
MNSSEPNCKKIICCNFLRLTRREIEQSRLYADCVRDCSIDNVLPLSPGKIRLSNEYLNKIILEQASKGQHLYCSMCTSIPSIIVTKHVNVDGESYYDFWNCHLKPKSENEVFDLSSKYSVHLKGSFWCIPTHLDILSLFGNAQHLEIDGHWLDDYVDSELDTSGLVHCSALETLLIDTFKIRSEISELASCGNLSELTLRNCLIESKLSAVSSTVKSLSIPMTKLKSIDNPHLKLRYLNCKNSELVSINHLDLTDLAVLEIDFSQEHLLDPILSLPSIQKIIIDVSDKYDLEEEESDDLEEIISEEAAYYAKKELINRLYKENEGFQVIIDNDSYMI